MSTHAFYSTLRHAQEDAEELAMNTGADVWIWERRGCWRIEEAPAVDDADQSDDNGWQVCDIVEPRPEPEERPRKLTRQEQLEALADSGCDTWSEYRGER